MYSIRHGAQRYSIFALLSGYGAILDSLSKDVKKVVEFLGNLTPLIPLSFEGEGEIKKEGLAPLLDTLLG